MYKQSTLESNKDSTPFSSLSASDIKGYLFEMESGSALEKTKIPFIGNSKDPIEWKRNVNINGKSFKGVDQKIPILDMAIECKFTSTRVWLGGLEANYVNRFKDSSAEHKIVLTNEKSHYSDSCINKLSSHGITLMELKELLQHIHKVSIQKFIQIFGAEKYNQLLDALRNRNRANTISYLSILLKDSIRVKSKEEQGNSNYLVSAVKAIEPFLDLANSLLSKNEITPLMLFLN